MAATKEGPGWWLASDGQWYPPDLHPDITGPRLAARGAHLTEGGRTGDAIAVAVDDLVVTHGTARTTPADPAAGPLDPSPGPRPGTQPTGTGPIETGPAEDDGVEIQPLGAVDRVLTGAAAVLVAASLAVFVLVAGDPVAGPDPANPPEVSADGGLADDATTGAATPAFGPTSVHDLRPGDCVLLPDPALTADAIDTVEGVPCEQADHRVVAVGPVGAAEEVYDAEAVERAGLDVCTDATDGGAGLMLAPSPTSWAEGDRRVVCLEALD